MSSNDVTPTTTPIFNATDPLNLVGLEKILFQAPLPPPLVWLLVTLVIRFFMTEFNIDGRNAGIVGLVFSTLTAGHMAKTTDQKWSDVLRECQANHTMVEFGRSTLVSKRSIRKHSWHWFEYWVDCVAFKKHIRLQEQVHNAEGLVTKWLKWRDRSPYLISTDGKFEPSEVKRPSSMPEKRVVTADRLTGGPNQSNGIGGARRLRMAYGMHDVEIPDGDHVEADFHWDRFKVALSSIICFTLFGWGLAYRSRAAAIAFTISANILTTATWLLCWGLPSTGEPWNFCQRISHDANRIHEAGRAFLTGRSTIDVILYLDHQQRWTWCRISDTWISVMIPTERPSAEYALGALSLLAHTVLPTGWINETNIKPNIIFALIALSLEYLHPLTGSVAGIAVGSLLHTFGIQPPKSGDWWILCFYLFLYGRVSGGYNLAPLVSWVSATGNTLYTKIFA